MSADNVHAESTSPRLPHVLKMEIRSCEELKALLTTRIRAKVKDPKVLRQLEDALADIVAYGTGGESAPM